MVFHLRSPQSANDAAAIERAMFEAKEKSMQAQLDTLVREVAVTKCTASPAWLSMVTDRFCDHGLPATLEL